MSIPLSCEVLVIGGGPAGSYAACVLAKEGVDTVLLEADHFPRYHIGESMLPSLRYFLRYVGADDLVKKHGFVQKDGAVFALDHSVPPAYTDFVGRLGPTNHSWNVVRSEFDHLLLQHAETLGARVFQGTRVDSVNFERSPGHKEDSSLGQPMSANWTIKGNGSSGKIAFRYIVDASGRNGIVSTKYMKNRQFNESLKNMAVWSYWEGVPPYTDSNHANRHNAPFFEALTDNTGWAWAIPLSNGKTSVGIVSRKDEVIGKKRAWDASEEQYYHRVLENLCPILNERLRHARRATNGDPSYQKVQMATDYSYSASSYASPYLRIVGDAGCFIDPYFSSGCHLALCSGLSAALTIQASRRGSVDESSAADWHSKCVQDGYTRFMIVVLATMKQIRFSGEPILRDFDEKNWERVFGLFSPIIQGTADRDNFAAANASGSVEDTLHTCVTALWGTKGRAASDDQPQRNDFLEGYNNDWVVDNFGVFNGLKAEVKAGSLGLTRVNA